MDNFRVNLTIRHYLWRVCCIPKENLQDIPAVLSQIVSFCHNHPENLVFPLEELTLSPNRLLPNIG